MMSRFATSSESSFAITSSFSLGFMMISSTVVPQPASTIAASAMADATPTFRAEFMLPPPVDRPWTRRSGRCRRLGAGRGRFLLGRPRLRLAALPRRPLLQHQGLAARSLEPSQLLVQNALLVGAQGRSLRLDLLLESVDPRLHPAGCRHAWPPRNTCSEGAGA